MTEFEQLQDVNRSFSEILKGCLSAITLLTAAVESLGKVQHSHQRMFEVIATGASESGVDPDRMRAELSKAADAMEEIAELRRLHALNANEASGASGESVQQ